MSGYILTLDEAQALLAKRDAEIERLCADKAELLAALEPFARAAKWVPYAGSFVRSDYRVVPLEWCFAADAAIAKAERALKTAER